ncbi:MAG: transcriptional repressor [Planctomycetes bacterium]|nr:transcriptional repressor [Planctomycetota bacterium]
MPFRSSDAAATLRAAGLVPTLPRRVIWGAFEGRLDHPTADGVFEATVATDAGISRATVYRALESFVGAGLARRLGHPGAAMRYDPRTTPHHHAICDDCGEVFDLEPEVLPRALARVDVPCAGFDVREVSLLVRGTCASCRP